MVNIDEALEQNQNARERFQAWNVFKLDHPNDPTVDDEVEKARKRVEKTSDRLFVLRSQGRLR